MANERTKVINIYLLITVGGLYGGIIQRMSLFQLLELCDFQVEILLLIYDFLFQLSSFSYTMGGLISGLFSIGLISLHLKRYADEKPPN